MSKLAMIPVGFILLRLWGALYRFLWIAEFKFDPNPPDELQAKFICQHRWLQVLTAIGDPGQACDD